MNYYNYFTEIEEHFVKKRGRSLLISPMDWNLIAAWRDAGIPLHVALRGIDIAMDGFLARQHRGTSRVNSLCYCHEAVMEAYAGHLEAHIGESAEEKSATPSGSGEEEQPATAEIAGFISERIDEIEGLCQKQYSGNAPEGLQRVLNRLREIAQDLETGNRLDTEALERDLTLVDGLLIEELRTQIPDEEAGEWEKEAKKDLKVYKKRLPRETYESIHENYIRDRVRRRFRIGELSLFRL